GTATQPRGCATLPRRGLVTLDGRFQNWADTGARPAMALSHEGRQGGGGCTARTDILETFCDLIGLEPELHDDEKSSTATKARVAAIIATEKFHGVPRWSLGIISCRCTYHESGTHPREGRARRAVRRSRWRATCSRFVPAPIRGDHYGYRPRSAALWVFVRRRASCRWMDDRSAGRRSRFWVQWGAVLRICDFCSRPKSEWTTANRWRSRSTGSRLRPRGRSISAGCARRLQKILVSAR